MSGCTENCWPIATDKRCLPQRHKEHKVEEAGFAQLITMRLPHPLLNAPPPAPPRERAVIRGEVLSPRSLGSGAVGEGFRSNRESSNIIKFGTKSEVKC